MALPKQVQQQLDEVEELEKQLEAQGEETKAKPEVKKKKTSKKAKAKDTEVEVTDDEPIEEPVAVEATPADDSIEEVSESFKQKYATLRGKYDAEVPRLHQQVKELTDQMNAIREEAQAAKKAEEFLAFMTEYLTNPDAYYSKVAPNFVKEITAEIKHFCPDFQVDYQPDSRQLIANKWPKSIDDSEARNDWGWKPEYNLRMMTTEMLEKLKEKYNNIKLK